MAYQLIQSWNHGWDLIWSSEDPGAVLAELGTDAGEVFELNEQLVAYFATSLAGRRQEDLDVILAKIAANLLLQLLKMVLLLSMLLRSCCINQL